MYYEELFVGFLVCINYVVDFFESKFKRKMFFEFNSF